MPKIFFSVLLFSIIFTTNSFSSCLVCKSDTVKPKIGFPAFSEINSSYGTDDSTKSLIQLFISRRRTGIFETVAFGTLGIVGEILVSPSLKSAVGYGAIGPALLASVIIGYSLIGIITGLCTWGKYTKRHLMELLINYKNGIPIPKKFTKLKAFKRNLKAFNQRKNL